MKPPKATPKRPAKRDPDGDRMQDLRQGKMPKGSKPPKRGGY